MTIEHEEGDVLNVVASEVAEELDRAQKDQDRLQDELECACEDLATASREFSNCRATVDAASAKLSSAFREDRNRWATHEAICAEGRKACHKSSELKRKATEPQENMISHRKRTRRITNEHARAEALVNNSLGTLGCCQRGGRGCTLSDPRSAGPRKQRDQVPP